ncbi:hypothetical protein, partial [Escherichia coli]|uniref:hypothetical protein n=1 Tax=Escherichia coli TaxID=562 RepID=UPI001BAFFA3E
PPPTPPPPPLPTQSKTAHVLHVHGNTRHHSTRTHALASRMAGCVLPPVDTESSQKTECKGIFDGC